MIDRDKFFSTIRPMFGGKISRDQVAGFNVILSEFERRLWADKRHLAYILATTHHETASTMQPIEEFGKGKTRPYGRPDPVTKQVYYGRGYVQLTWKENYVKAGAKLGEDFVYHPDRVMDPKHAVNILFDGMGEGWFAGDKKGRHNLTRYFNDKKDDPEGARRIINGTDRATQIAMLYNNYLRALT